MNENDKLKEKTFTSGVEEGLQNSQEKEFNPLKQ